MKRWMAVAGLLLVWDFSMGASCGVKPPQPPVTCPEACPAGTHCEGNVCVADPPPPCPDLEVPWCHEAVPPMNCGLCKHQPPGERCPIIAPECEPTDQCEGVVCPPGQHCVSDRSADPGILGLMMRVQPVPVKSLCVADTPPPPDPPTSCTIPLNGTPQLKAYFLYARIVDFTPVISNAARCALPEVGYAGRQACPVCDEACTQRGVCEVELMGGPAPTFSCASATLQCSSEDGWKVRVSGIGKGTLTGCYPNNRACVTIQLSCDTAGCTRQSNLP